MEAALTEYEESSCVKFVQLYSRTMNGKWMQIEVTVIEQLTGQLATSSVMYIDCIVIVYNLYYKYDSKQLQ